MVFVSAPLDLLEWGRQIQKGGCVLSIKCHIQDFLYLQNIICLNKFDLYNTTIIFTTNVWYFFFNLAHLILTTVYLDKIFDLSLFYNESKSEISYTIKFYFILNLHLVSYHTTSKQYKYTWPKNIILLFYAFPFQMTYLI